MYMYMYVSLFPSLSLSHTHTHTLSLCITYRMAAGLAIVFIAAFSLLCGANRLHEFVKHARATPARAGRVHALPPECRAREATTFLGL